MNDAQNLYEKRPAWEKHGRVIRCHDCRKAGYCIPHVFQPWEIPWGWRMTWAGFTPLFLCPDCISKRRARWAQILKDKASIHR